MFWRKKTKQEVRINNERKITSTTKNKYIKYFENENNKGDRSISQTS
jgi:hypothetical protein